MSEESESLFFPPASQSPTNGSNVSDAASLIAAVATLVAGSTHTIMARLDENSRAATERWRLHDEQLASNTARVIARFEKIEQSLLIVEQSLKMHLDEHHDSDVAMDARIKPVRASAAWFVANYKNILILAAGLLGLTAVLADILARYLGAGT